MSSSESSDYASSEEEEEEEEEEDSSTSSEEEDSSISSEQSTCASPDDSLETRKLTVDSFEAVLEMKWDSVESLVSRGANPNLPLKKCLYKDNNGGKAVTFKKRVENIEKLCTDKWDDDALTVGKNIKKLSVINLVLYIRYAMDCINDFDSTDDIHVSDNMDTTLEESGDSVDKLITFLIGHEKTKLVKPDESDICAETPFQVASKLARDYKEGSSRRSDEFNTMPKLLKRMLFIDEKKERHWKNQLTNLLRDSKFADITFQCPDGQVTAHKCILAANVEYFAKAFSNSWKEANSGVWKTDNPQSVTEALVNFIYTGEVSDDVLQEHAIRLFPISREYQMTELQTKCQDWLTTHLTVSNICDVLLCAHVHSIKDMKKACFGFLKEKAVIVLGEQHIVQFGADNADLWKEVKKYMQSSCRKRKRN